MPIQSMNATGFVRVCPKCRHHHTHHFNRGGLNLPPGPYSFKAGQTLVFRFDADGGNVGVVETVTLTGTEVTREDLMAKLSASLTKGTVTTDFEGILVESKITGPTSCAELTPDSTGYSGLGTQYPLSHDPHCCGRPVLGYAQVPSSNLPASAIPPGPLPAGRMNPGLIMLRGCYCGIQEVIFTDHAYMPHDNEGPNDRLARAIRTLAKFLFDNGWTDPDMAEMFAAKPFVSDYIFTDFPNTPVVVGTDDEMFPAPVPSPEGSFFVKLPAQSVRRLLQ